MPVSSRGDESSITFPDSFPFFPICSHSPHAHTHTQGQQTAATEWYKWACLVHKASWHGADPSLGWSLKPSVLKSYWSVSCSC